MIDYEEDWIYKVCWKRRGSVSLHASYFAVPSAFLAVLLLAFATAWDSFLHRIGLVELTATQVWTSSTGLLLILVSFRTQQALSRFWEGTSLLHQMRGEWFDSVSCCVTFSMGAREAKPMEVLNFRHTLVRLMSLCHGSALLEISGVDRHSASADRLAFLDLAGLDDSTVSHLKILKKAHGFNRVECLLHLLQTLIHKAHGDSILDIPAPILSRVYQTLSRGFVNLLNAKKITDTRFPFPYAQLIDTLLLLHTILTPVMVSAVVKSMFWAAILTFVPVFGTFSLNLIAIPLENPFGDDLNDLPVEQFQKEMNSSLLMLLHARTDHVSGIRKGQCIMNFRALMQQRLFQQGQGRRTSVTSLNETPSRQSSACQTPRQGPEEDEEELQNSDFAMCAEEMEPQLQALAGRIEAFAHSLPSWTQTIESQVIELVRSFGALHTLADSD